MSNTKSTGKRYHIKITVTSRTPGELSGTILDDDFDEVNVSEQRNVTPVYQAFSDKPLAIIPSAKTVLSVSGVRIDHSVNAEGLHTMLDPVPLSKEDLGAVMSPEGIPSIDALERQARVSMDKSLARTLKKNRTLKKVKR